MRRSNLNAVIPAKADLKGRAGGVEIQNHSRCRKKRANTAAFFLETSRLWIPAFAGMTALYPAKDPESDHAVQDDTCRSRYTRIGIRT